MRASAELTVSPNCPVAGDRYTPPMDYRWAAGFLVDHLQAIEQCGKLPMLTKERRAAIRELNGRVPTVNAILAAVAPDFGSVTGGTYLRDHRSGVSRIQRALNLISEWPRVPGTNGELLDFDLPLEMLHSVVRQAAQPQWKACRFRAAVSDASTAVNDFAQQRLGRHDISGKDLMAQAFTTKEPEPGKSRLRCPGNPRSETVRSQQEGAIAFASGCMQLIRNPAHHMNGDWNPGHRLRAPGSPQHRRPPDRELEPGPVHPAGRLLVAGPRGRRRRGRCEDHFAQVGLGLPGAAAKCGITANRRAHSAGDPQAFGTARRRRAGRRHSGPGRPLSRL